MAVDTAARFFKLLQDLSNGAHAAFSEHDTHARAHVLGVPQKAKLDHADVPRMHDFAVRPVVRTVNSAVPATANPVRPADAAVTVAITLSESGLFGGCCSLPALAALVLVSISCLCFSRVGSLNSNAQNLDGLSHLFEFMK